MKQIIAVADKLVVELMETSNVTPGGLIIPETAQPQEPQRYGKVLSVGVECDKAIQEGDIVMFHASFGMDIIVDEKLMKVLGNTEVYAILREVEDDGAKGSE